MVGKTLVFGSVATERLMTLIPMQSAVDFFLLAIYIVFTLNNIEILAVAYALPVLLREVAFAHRKVVDGIEDIGLADAIVANYAVDVAAELQFLFLKALKVHY